MRNMRRKSMIYITGDTHGIIDIAKLNHVATALRKVDDEKTEYVLKYEFEGSDESFRMLKICTQFVLDTFAQSDFDRFNIAVYGKKKNY